MECFLFANANYSWNFKKKTRENCFLKIVYFSRKNIGGIFSQRTGPSPGQVRLSARAPPLPSGGGRRIHSEKKIEISEMFCLFFPGDGTFSSLGDSTPPSSPPECGWVHVASPRGDSPPRWVENACGARGAVYTCSSDLPTILAVVQRSRTDVGRRGFIHSEGDLFISHQIMWFHGAPMPNWNSSQVAVNRWPLGFPWHIT